MNTRDTTLTKGFDWPLIYLYMAVVVIGLLSIYAVEHHEDQTFLYAITHATGSFSQQLRWEGVSIILGTIILLLDSKFFTATANLFYAAGILLLLVVLVAGTDIKGSHSWLVIGGFQFQPAESTKLCTLLALSKYLSSVEVDFTRLRSQFIAAAIVLAPAAIILLQDVTG